MFSQHPELAREFADETKDFSKLPERVGDKSKSPKKKPMPKTTPAQTEKAARSFGRDDQFERQFSGVAHAHIRNAAPGLLDYELGFQLIDRSDDDKRAAGVVVFKIDKSILLAPVFYLNKGLKGEEMLYLVDQDMFVPMNDEWVNDVLQRRPPVSGESVPRNSHAQLGVVGPRLAELFRSPLKSAAAEDNGPVGVAAWMRKLARIASSKTGDQTLAKCASHLQSLTLPEFVKIASAEQLAGLADWCRRSPEVAGYVSQRLNGQSVAELAQKAATEASNLRAAAYERLALSGARPVSLEPRQQKSAVTVYRKSELSVVFDAADLSESEKEELVQTGSAIRDTRPESETSTVFLEEEPCHLDNPTGPTVGRVLLQGGADERCVILPKLIGNGSLASAYLVLSLEGKRRNVVAHPQRIWLTSQEGPEALTEWFDSLPDAKSLSISGDDDDRPDVSFVQRIGDGQYLTTAPVTVYGEKQDIGDIRSYGAYARSEDSRYTTQPGASDYRYGSPVFLGDDLNTLNLGDRRGGKIKLIDAKLYVPDDAKRLDLGVRYSSRPTSVNAPTDRTEVLPLGDWEDVRRDTTARRSKMACLKIAKTDRGYFLNSQVYSKSAAMEHMVVERGVGKLKAAELLERADRRLPTTAWVKEALRPGEVPEGSAVAPPMPPDQMVPGPGLLAGELPDVNERLTVDSMSTRNTNPEIYDPLRGLYDDIGTHMTGQAARGVASGDGSPSTQALPELIDNSLIARLIKTYRTDSIIDRLMPKLTAGMDACAQLLISLYWDGKKWADRYGDADIPAIEDGLRNSFGSIGDVVLSLKQRAVDPFASEGLSVDMQSMLD